MMDNLQAELDWWKAWLRPDTLPRLLAVYGMRYLTFWFMEFQNLGRVCDIGSGPVSAAWVAERFDQLICVDPNAAPYQLIATDLGLRPTVIQPDDAGLEDRSFDTVLCLNTLDHVADPQAVLHTCQRLVKPGGKVLVWMHLRDEDPADGLHLALNETAIFDMATAAGLLKETSAAGHCETAIGGTVPGGELALWATFRA